MYRERENPTDDVLGTVVFGLREPEPKILPEETKLKMAMAQDQMPPPKHSILPKEMQLANTVLFFVPGEEKGLLIYNQTPSVEESLVTGFLPEGKFYTSSMHVVDFDPKLHGEPFNVIKTISGFSIQQVIMVDEETFLKVALQGIYPEKPKDERESHYFVIDMYDTSRDVRGEIIQALYEEDKLDPSKKEILKAAIVSSENAIKTIATYKKTTGKK